MGDGHFHPTFPVVKKGETMVKLLIAEDEALEREAIKFIIDNHFPDCFEIREAGNGRETIAFARQFFPDLLFLDIKTPGENRRNTKPGAQGDR
jgi:chemotaxis response regulator CheB